MTKQICCNCKKEFEGVYKLKEKEHKKEYKLDSVDMALCHYIELYQYDFCEHCNCCQLIKEKEE